MPWLKAGGLLSLVHGLTPGDGYCALGSRGDAASSRFTTRLASQRTTPNTSTGSSMLVPMELCHEDVSI